MAFEKVILATGEARGDYIQRRLQDGIAPENILGEINAEGMFSGLPGQLWTMQIVWAEQRKLKKKPLLKVDAPAAVAAAEVPAEYEGVLDADDMAEIRAEAQAKIDKKKREAARKDALVKATQELERAAREAEQRGTAKGDLVDIHIDLAPYTDRIILDGKTFMHGSMHRVPRKVAAVLQEQVQRSWDHEGNIRGKNENAYRRPHTRTVGGGTGVRA